MTQFQHNHFGNPKTRQNKAKLKNTKKKLCRVFLPLFENFFFLFTLGPIHFGMNPPLQVPNSLLLSNSLSYFDIIFFSERPSNSASNYV